MKAFPFVFFFFLLLLRRKTNSTQRTHRSPKRPNINRTKTPQCPNVLGASRVYAPAVRLRTHWIVDSSGFTSFPALLWLRRPNNKRYITHRHTNRNWWLSPQSVHPFARIIRATEPKNWQIKLKIKWKKRDRRAAWLRNWILTIILKCVHSLFGNPKRCSNPDIHALFHFRTVLLERNYPVTHVPNTIEMFHQRSVPTHGEWQNGYRVSVCYCHLWPHLAVCIELWPRPRCWQLAPRVHAYEVHYPRANVSCFAFEHIAPLTVNEFVCPIWATIETKLMLGRVFASDHRMKITVNTMARYFIGKVCQKNRQRKFIILCTQRMRSIRIE